MAIRHLDWIVTRWSNSRQPQRRPTDAHVPQGELQRRTVYSGPAKVDAPTAGAVSVVIATVMVAPFNAADGT